MRHPTPHWQTRSTILCLVLSLEQWWGLTKFYMARKKSKVYDRAVNPNLYHSFFENPVCCTTSSVEAVWYRQHYLAGTFNPCVSLPDAKGYLLHMDETRQPVTKPRYLTRWPSEHTVLICPTLFRIQYFYHGVLIHTGGDKPHVCMVSTAKRVARCGQFGWLKGMWWFLIKGEVLSHIF